MASYTVVKQPVSPGNYQFGRAFSERSLTGLDFKTVNTSNMKDNQKNTGRMFKNGIRAPLLSDSVESAASILLTSSTHADRLRTDGCGGRTDGGQSAPLPSGSPTSAPGGVLLNNNSLRKNKALSSKNASGQATEANNNVLIQYNYYESDRPISNSKSIKSTPALWRRSQMSSKKIHASKTPGTAVFSKSYSWNSGDKLPDVVHDRHYQNTYQPKTTFKLSMPEITAKNHQTFSLKDILHDNAKAGKTQLRFNNNHFLVHFASAADGVKKRSEFKVKVRPAGFNPDQREDLSGEEGCLYAKVKESMFSLSNSPERPLRQEKLRYRPTKRQHQIAAGNPKPSPVLCSPRDFKSVEAYLKYMESLKDPPPVSPVFGRPQTGSRARVNTAVTAQSPSSFHPVADRVIMNVDEDNLSALDSVAACNMPYGHDSYVNGKSNEQDLCINGKSGISEHHTTIQNYDKEDDESEFVTVTQIEQNNTIPKKTVNIDIPHILYD